jgi:hypothetical protein
MTRLLRICIIVFLTILVLSVPAYLLRQHELSDPEGSGRLLRGFVDMTLLPAVGFPIPLAIILFGAWTVGWKLTLWRAAVSGACAVVFYVCAISIYVIHFQPNSNFRNADFLSYLAMRLLFSVPSILAATVVTGLAAWIACKAVSETVASHPARQ